MFLFTVATKSVIICATMISTVLRALYSQEQLEQMYCKLYQRMGAVVLVHRHLCPRHTQFKMLYAPAIGVIPPHSVNNVPEEDLVLVLSRQRTLYWSIPKHQLAYHVVLETMRVWLRQRQFARPPPRQESTTTPVDQHLQTEVQGPEASCEDTYFSQKLPRKHANVPRPNLEILQWCNESPGAWIRHNATNDAHGNMTANARTKGVIRYL